jgi:hypothetical protein
MTSGVRAPAPLRACPYQRDSLFQSTPSGGGRRPLRSRPFVRLFQSTPSGGGRRPHTDVTRQKPPRTRQKPPEARNAPEPARSPYRARRTAGAYGGAHTDRRTRPRQRYAPSASRQKPPRTRQKPPEARNAPEPARSPYRARRTAGAYGGARTDRRTRPRQRYAPSASRQKPPRTRQEPAASAYRALLRFSTITDPVRIRLRRPGIA